MWVEDHTDKVHLQSSYPDSIIRLFIRILIFPTIFINISLEIIDNFIYICYDLGVVVGSLDKERDLI
jgi:hypothetical protein